MLIALFSSNRTVPSKRQLFSKHVYHWERRRNSWGQEDLSSLEVLEAGKFSNCSQGASVNERGLVGSKVGSVNCSRSEYKSPSEALYLKGNRESWDDLWARVTQSDCADTPNIISWPLNSRAILHYLSKNESRSFQCYSSTSCHHGKLCLCRALEGHGRRQPFFLKVQVCSCWTPETIWVSPASPALDSQGL